MNQSQPVRVTDIDMSFGQMVWFMVKWAIASIPAAIVLGIIFTLFAVIISVLLMALGLGAAAAHGA
jgi:hypothetical protein